MSKVFIDADELQRAIIMYAYDSRPDLDVMILDRVCYAIAEGTDNWSWECLLIDGIYLPIYKGSMIYQFQVCMHESCTGVHGTFSVDRHSNQYAVNLTDTLLHKTI